MRKKEKEKKGRKGKRIKGKEGGIKKKIKKVLRQKRKI